MRLIGLLIMTKKIDFKKKKSFDSGQPARTAQAGLNRNFFLFYFIFFFFCAFALSSLFTNHGSYPRSVIPNDQSAGVKINVYFLIGFL